MGCKVKLAIILAMAGCGASCILAATVLRLWGISDTQSLDALAAASLGYLAGASKIGTTKGEP
jgi:hypothetical protein